MKNEEIRKKLETGDIFGLVTAASEALAVSSEINIASNNFAAIANKHQRLLNNHNANVTMRFHLNGDEYHVTSHHIFEKIKHAVLEQMTVDMIAARTVLDDKLKKALG